ncbi:CvpA family protein [Omnitrophica bacterium]|nr:CvpA family protein [Candidatus Omnitrophota bacterium]
MELGNVVWRINWVDILILILLIRTSYVGYTRGLSSEVMPLIATFAALVISLHFYGRIGAFITNHTPLSSTLSNFTSYAFIGFSIIYLFHLAMVFLRGKVINVQVETLYDTIFGLTFGIFRGILLVSFIVFALGIAPISYIRDSAKQRSLMGEKFSKVGPLIHTRTMRIIKRN